MSSSGDCSFLVAYTLVLPLARSFAGSSILWFLSNKATDFKKYTDIKIVSNIPMLRYINSAGVTAQITPPPPPQNSTQVYSELYPGIIWNIPCGIVWEPQ